MLLKINHTQISNDFIDNYISKINGGSAKVFLAIARKTIGWHKETDAISLSQIMEITGLSRQGCVDSIGELESKELIIVDRGDTHTNKYTINYGKVVNLLDQTSQKSRPQAGEGSQESRHTKEKNINKNKETNPLYLKLSRLLLDLIEKNDAKIFIHKDKESIITYWVEDIRRLVEIDKRSEQEIEKVIKWCQQDDFWKSNILSAAKLRKQFPRLYMQANKNCGTNKGPEAKINTYVPEYVPPEDRAPAEAVAALRKKLRIV